MFWMLFIFLILFANIIPSDVLVSLALPDTYKVGDEHFDIFQDHRKIISEAKALKHQLNLLSKRGDPDTVCVQEDPAIMGPFSELMILSWLSQQRDSAEKMLENNIKHLSEHAIASLINVADKYNHKPLLEDLVAQAAARLKIGSCDNSPLIADTTEWSADSVRRYITAQIDIKRFFDRSHCRPQYLATNNVALLALTEYKKDIAWICADGGTYVKRGARDDIERYIEDSARVDFNNDTSIIDLISGDERGLLIRHEDGTVNYFKAGNFLSGKSVDYTRGPDDSLICTDLCEQKGLIVEGRENQISIFDITRARRDRKLSFEEAGKITKIKIHPDYGHIIFTCDAGLALCDFQTGAVIDSYPIKHKQWDVMDDGIVVIQNKDYLTLYDWRQKKSIIHASSEMADPKSLSYFDKKLCVVGRPRIDIRDLRFLKPFFSVCGKTAVWNKMAVGFERSGDIFVGTDAGITKIDGKSWQIVDDIYKTDSIQSAVAVDRSAVLMADRKCVPDDILMHMSLSVQNIIRKNHWEISKTGRFWDKLKSCWGFSTESLALDQ